MSSCGNGKTIEKTPPFFLGQWKFVTIETKLTEQLDDSGRIVYQEQMKEFTENSFLHLKDSTFSSQLGPEKEDGLWRYDPVDSVLSLKSKHWGIRMFDLSTKQGQLLLRLRDSKSGEYWLLKKQ